MGIYDRDYMKAPQERKRLQPKSTTVWQRLRFKIWDLFHGKRFLNEGKRFEDSDSSL